MTTSQADSGALLAIEMAAINARYRYRLPQTFTMAVRSSIYERVNSIVDPGTAYHRGTKWLAGRGVILVVADVALDLPVTEYGSTISDH